MTLFSLAQKRHSGIMKLCDRTVQSQLQ